MALTSKRAVHFRQTRTRCGNSRYFFVLRESTVCATQIRESTLLERTKPGCTHLAFDERAPGFMCFELHEVAPLNLALCPPSNCHHTLGHVTISRKARRKTRRRF